MGSYTGYMSEDKLSESRKNQLITNVKTRKDKADSGQFVSTNGA